MFKKLVNRVKSQDDKTPLQSRPTTTRTTSKTRQHDPAEPEPERRVTRRSTRVASRKVSKRRSSSSLSASRVELVKPVVEGETRRPRLTTVTEGTKETSYRSSPRRKHRSASRKSPRASDTTRSPDLAHELLLLQEENAALKARLERREERSRKKDISAGGSAESEEQRRTLVDLTIEVAAAKEDLKREKAKTKEAERSRNRLVRQLGQSTNVQPTLYDDAHFKDSVQELRYQVHNWVKNVKWTVPNRGRTRQFVVPTVYKFLKPTCAEYQSYLSSRSDIELLMQAHIWQYLVSEIFDTPCFWAETREHSEAEEDLMNNPFAVLKRHLRTEMGQKHEASFHEWRATSARLLAKRPPKQIDDGIFFAATTLLDRLNEYFQHIHDGDAHLRSLENIFRSAINLDYLMQQERAEYLFWPATGGNAKVYFDEERFNVPDDYDEEEEVVSGKTPIKLVVEPSFCKLGDANGENYDETCCLLKGEVEI